MLQRDPKKFENIFAQSWLRMYKWLFGEFTGTPAYPAFKYVLPNRSHKHLEASLIGHRRRFQSQSTGRRGAGNDKRQLQDA